MGLANVSGITLASFNTNGLGDFAKRSNYITHVNSLGVDLVVFVDTRLDESKGRMLKNEADSFEWFFAYGLLINGTLSRGVSIGIRKSSMILPGESSVLVEGNALRVNFKFEGHEFVVYGIYGPSDGDRPNFFESIFNKCAMDTERFKLLAGDFNVPLNFNRDTLNIINDSRKRARGKILEKMEDLGFKDIYRTLNGNRELYTWHSGDGSKKSRLDYFLVSENLIPAIKKAGRGIFFRSDHRSVDIFVDFSGIKCGQKKWRYTASMRQSQDIRNVIVNEIYESHFRYIDQSENALTKGDFFSVHPANIHDLTYNLPWGDLLNVVLNDVKNAIISFESGQRRRAKDEIKALQEEIALLEDDPLSDQNRYTVMKNRYDELIDAETVEKLTNRQDSFKLDGERPSSFFLNLEKNRVSEKYIPRLREGNVIITDQVKIERSIREFYKDLYSNKDNLRTGLSIEEYIGAEGRAAAPKLAADLANSIEGNITLEEIWEVLKKSKDSSSPGLSGIGYSFFKDFWPHFGNLLVNTFNEAFILGKLPDFMSKGIISLLPKGDKDRTFLKNWRPITLLECAYKLMSGCLASRLNKVINCLVDPVQKGFVPDRNISENTRTFYDILDYAKRHGKGGTAIVLDYEKAFDTLSHTYFEEVLTFFGFGENFRRWIKICLSNFYAFTSHADNLSEQFRVERGARQGDPLSPPIFALAIEIFSIKIRNSPEAIPYKMEDILIKLLLYADDSIVITIQDENSVRYILNAVQDFFGVSGLKIQLAKSNIFNFGVEGPDLCTDIVIEREKRIQYLGMQFDNMLIYMDENITQKIEEIIKLGKKWLYRYLTPLGRSIVAKSLLIPKVCHILSCVPVSTKTIDHLQREIFNFIWGGEKKQPAFSRDDAQVTSFEGGLNMPDIHAALKSYQISWLRRAINNKECNVWRNWLDKLVIQACEMNFTDLLVSGNRHWQMAANKISNNFWKRVFKAYNKLTGAMVEAEPHRLLTMSIWNSTFFRHNNRFFNPKVRRYENFSHKFSTPIDLLGEDGCIMQYNIANEKFGPDFPAEILISIEGKLNTISRTFKPKNPSNIFGPLFIPYNYEILTKYKKGCSFWNRYLKRKKNTSIRAFEEKTATSLGVQLDGDRWKQIYWLVTNIRYGNDIKWLIHQVLRGSLTTNIRLVKMKIRNCELCTFCGETRETIRHLFWDCRIVSQFLNNIKEEMDTICPYFDIGFSPANAYGKEVFILGDNRARSGSGPNYLYNITKKYIWNTRCREGLLSEAAFRNFLRKRLLLDRTLAGRYGELNYIHDIGVRMGIG